jgi:hypothetical protein
MTVSSTTTKNSYSGNGSTTTFAYGFKIFADADLTVILRSSTGVETVQSLTTNYTVTNAGNASGGNVVFGSAPASGVTVVIRRNMALTQSTDYVANDPFPAATHEDALDRLTFISQQMQEEVDRTIKLSRTNTMTSTEFTVGATDRASKVLAFDSSGELSVTQELGTFKGSDATVTTAAYVERDIIKSTTTAELNNVYICVAASVVGDSLTDTDHFALLVDAVSAASSATTATTKASEASTSATNAANSASTASTQASNASTSASTASTQATNAANSATAAASSAASAATALDNFDDIFLGAKSSDPSTDNDGDALNAGDLYFNTTSNQLKVFNGSSFQTIDTFTTGISSGNVPVFTSGVADNDFLRVDGTSIEGRSASEVLSDIGGQATLTFGISNTNAVKIDSASVADDEFARFTANGLESRSAAEVLSDIGASPVAGSSSIVTTGALNSGSITSGFGNIDTGSSTITTTGAVSVGAFTSNGIDDNADATAMTISSDEDVMIGTTDESSGAKFIVGSTSDDKRAFFQGSNQYRVGLKNGSNNHVFIGSGGADNFRVSNSSGSTLFELNSSGNIVLPSSNAGIHLGVTSATASNLLDDYEEGTFTPTMGQYAGTPSISGGTYTKIGRQVIANVQITLDGTSDTSNFQVQGLPFTVDSSNQGGFLIYNNSSLGQYYVLVSSGTTNAFLYTDAGAHFTYNGAGNNNNFRFCFVYTST